MEQAIFNLIQNAIEASPVNSIIDIRYWESAQQVGLHIDDQGPGFTEVSPIKTSQLHKKLNYGLGIPFAQKVIKQHHGHVVFETNLQGGARVSLTLDINNEQTF
ncbi:MAG: sensor histidine kinase [Gammaproteobacteria bacterium]|nr:sensor histidine kinase [Gammaproteobacteria bacterium]